MVVTRTLHPQAASADVPPVPLTVEGYSVLHQMMRFRWAAWRPLLRRAEARNRRGGERPAGWDGAEFRRSIRPFFAART